MRRAIKIAGLFALILGLPAFAHAQIIEQQSCPSGTTPITAPGTTTINNVNSQVLHQWCVDNNGNMYSTGHYHTGTETFANINTVLYVDGTKYALTVTGVNQAITDANAAGGGKVVITKPMNVNANIVLQSGVDVECTGWASAPLTWNGGPGPNAFFFGSNVTDVGVHWCRMIGPNATTAGTSDIRGVELDGTNRHNFTYNKITGVSYGVFEQGFGGSPGNDGVIDHNWIQTATTQGIATFDNKIRITFNSIDNVGTSNLHHGIYISGGSDVLVQGNQISNIQGFCINAFTSTLGQNNDNVKIIGNGCKTVGQGSSGARGGISIGTSVSGNFCRNYSVIGNTIDGLAGDRGIWAGDCNDVVISGNTIRNFGASEGIYVTGTAVQGSVRVNVSDNTLDTNTSGNAIRFQSNGGAVAECSAHDNKIFSVSAVGIWLQGATDCSISGNRIRDYNTANASNAGIFLSATALKNNVYGNRITNSVATGFAIQVNAAADADNQLFGNILVGSAGTITDSGTRTIIFGNKINNTDALLGLGSGINIGSVTFATLPASPNGTIIFCSDCNATCAAGAGTGRTCARENGAWVGF